MNLAKYQSSSKLAKLDEIELIFPVCKKTLISIIQMKSLIKYG